MLYLSNICVIVILVCLQDGVISFYMSMARGGSGRKSSAQRPTSRGTTNPSSAMPASNRGGVPLMRPKRVPSMRSNSSRGRSERGAGRGGGAEEGIRLNKCLPALSRRGADDAIAGGRVSVNGNVVLSAGVRVHLGDLVALDGKKQHWEGKIKAQSCAPAKRADYRKLVYLKYWKPRGITSTSDVSDPSSIILAGRFELFPQRLFTVGRLDKDSTGLILLTSDGRVNNALLDPRTKKKKRYEVTLDKRPSDAHIQTWRDGIVITTPVQRESGRSRDVTARTLPCDVRRLRPNDMACTCVEFCLTEGRNRQIRRMCEALGYHVLGLHRTHFAGIDLKGLGANEWLELNDAEMKVVVDAMGLM